MSQARAMPMLKETLDLYDIALLLNHERVASEPRFRGARLVDISRDGQSFVDDRLAPHWDRTAYFKSAGVPIEKDPSVPSFEFVSSSDEPRRGASLIFHNDEATSSTTDSPTNMIATDAQRVAAASLVGPPYQFSKVRLSDKECETLFLQSRSSAASETSVHLLQAFFNLYPADTLLRVRTYDRNDPEYITSISHRLVLAYSLRGLRMHTIVSFLPETTCHSTPGADGRARHTVITFGDASARWDNLRTVLDMSSLQFGDAGRGVKGKGTFVLEPLKAYDARLDHVAEANDLLIEDMVPELPTTENNAEEERFLKEVAAKVKSRWDQRATEPWCGHCGAPAPKVQAKCCSAARYCNRDHQVSAWPYHKMFCGKS
ncbi:hypothetical protein BD626DRAFT_402358 [Schizophyllum amplum]|uniref:MYND-type domain-containing protein n=1 Tax=Schizophyllum amplum TaxID=97359 RepID=A0A550CFJ2_9AGAR|nr:hypothetical protein BD626DRAFT_402358 [Auriculariopsis ampla]